MAVISSITHIKTDLVKLCWRMPNLTSHTTVLSFTILGNISSGNSLDKLRLVLEGRKVISPFRRCEDCSVFGKITIMRLSHQLLLRYEGQRTLYRLSSMKSRTSILTLIGGSLFAVSSVAVTRR